MAEKLQGCGPMDVFLAMAASQDKRISVLAPILIGLHDLHTASQTWDTGEWFCDACGQQIPCTVSLQLFDVAAEYMHVPHWWPAL